MQLSVADTGWSYIILVSSFCGQMITGGFYYAVGVIHIATLDRFDEDVGKTSWASSLYMSLTTLTGVLASAFINMYSCRVTMIIGSIFMTVGFIICAFVQSLDLVIIFFGGIVGFGAGLCYLTSAVIIGFNFNKRRNMASGISASGVGVGVFILAPLIESAREEYGSSGFFFILAGVALHCAIFGCLFFPSELEVNSSKQINNRNNVLSRKSNILNNVFQSFKIIRHKPLFCFCVSMFFASFGISLVSVHFPNYAKENGASASTVSVLLSLNGISSCVSRTLAGIATHNNEINEMILYFGTFGLLGISTMLFPLFAYTYEGQVVYAVILGLYSGCFNSVINTIIIKLVGIGDLATGYGMTLFFYGIGSLIGAPIAGTIIDFAGSYGSSFLLAGSCITMSALLGIATQCFKRTGQDNTEAPIPTVAEMVII
ncbi:monocarboxylate transporter 12-like [Argopecten irradians]|uniref:monocarboxylate transporter 12-like n=1 Tax=Argopecten irradians TaxID=31199 RepID=UPI00371009FB